MQYVATKTYDYHPPMPLPDPEAPEQSLGDCAICMDAILLDPAGRRPPEKEREKLTEWNHETAVETGGRHRSLGSAGVFINAVQMGIETAGTRKIYSLAPCHHLFVSPQFRLCLYAALFSSGINQLISTPNVWKG